MAIRCCRSSLDDARPVPDARSDMIETPRRTHTRRPKHNATRKSRQATQAWRTEQHATKHIVQDSTHTTHIHIQKSPLRRLPFCTSCTWYFANSMRRACASEPVELLRSCLDRLEALRKRSGCNSPTLARKDRSRATRAHRHPVYAQSITSLCCCRKETFKLQKGSQSTRHRRCT